MMKEKLTYSKGEKIFEIAGAVITVGAAAGYAALMAAGKNSGSAVILLVVSLIIYTALTLCSAFPQHTNIANEPEKCSEKSLRLIRGSCIAAKIILIMLLFVTAAVSAD